MTTQADIHARVRRLVRPFKDELVDIALVDGEFGDSVVVRMTRRPFDVVAGSPCHLVFSVPTRNADDRAVVAATVREVRYALGLLQQTELANVMQVGAKIVLPDGHQRQVVAVNRATEKVRVADDDVWFSASECRLP